jgi:hypothetical protein
VTASLGHNLTTGSGKGSGRVSRALFSAQLEIVSVDPTSGVPDDQPIVSNV